MTSSFLPNGKGAHCPGMTRRAGLALAVPALHRSRTLTSARQTVQRGQGLSGSLLVQGIYKSFTTWKILCPPLSSWETAK